MSKTVTIDGTSYPVVINSFSATLQAGLSGVELSCQLTNVGVSPPDPESNAKVTLTLGSVSFTCRLGSVTEDSSGRLIVYSLTAYGPQERLKRPASCDIRASVSASSILTTLLGGSGLAGSVPNDKTLNGGFTFSGSLDNAIQALASRANMVFYLDTTGTVNLYDRDNLPAAPFDWIVDNAATLISGLRKSHVADLPVTRVVVHGGVKKYYDGQGDSETQTLTFTGDGTNVFFSYPRETDEITDIRVNGTPVTVTYLGSGDEPDVDVVNRRNEYRLEWNAAPGAAAAIEVDITLQFATGVANDTTTQADLAAKFTDWDGVVLHEIQDTSIRTQEQADQAAVSLLAQLNTARKEASAQVHSSSIFYPCQACTVTETRSTFDADLFVVSNSLKWDTGKDRWAQSVSLSNALPGGIGGSGLGAIAGAIAGTTGKTSNPPTKPPPREQSGASPSFTVTVTPISRTAMDGSATALEFTVEVTGATGFTDPVTLSASGLSGDTFVFTDDVILPGDTTTLTVTPTDGEWTDGDTDEEGTFTVTGTSGTITAEDTADILIEDCSAFASFVIDADCSGVPSDCCDLPRDYDPFFETPLSIPWTVTFYDGCDPPNVVGGDSGTMTVSRDTGCVVILAGDEFTTPDTVVHSVWAQGECDCVIP